MRTDIDINNGIPPEVSMHVERLMENAKEAVGTRGCLDALTKQVQKLISQRNKDVISHENDELKNSVTSSCTKKLAEFPNEPSNALNMGKRDFESRTSIELSYMKAWEKARREQVYLKCSASLERRNMSLGRCFALGKNENIVSVKIESFLRQNLAAKKKEAIQWLQRYQTKWEMYERDIQTLRNEITVREENMRALKEEYDKRQEFIDTYLAEKARKQEAKDREERMQKSAIKIQVWWRGVIVRRKLGPYRIGEKKRKRAAKVKK